MSIPWVCAWGLAFVLGLGLPRSFLLLDAVLAGSAWLALRRPGPRPSGLLIWSGLWLLLFGLSYAGFQVGWQVWSPPREHLAEIVAVVLLPAAALAVGWLLPRFGRSLGSGLILAYASGALLYALLSLALSRTPWWNLAQTFVHDVRVPWGPQQWLNMRSVEQRAFLALAFAPVALPLLLRPRQRRPWLALLLLVLAGLAAHTAWALQGRIGLGVLGMAALPWLALVPRRAWRGGLALAVAAAAGAALLSGRICDERWWLQATFLRHLAAAPWGGRLIRFDYRDCRPDVVNHFGSFPGSSAFSPHNLVLDVYNDVGWLPSLCLLLAVLPLLIRLLIAFGRAFSTLGWDWQLALRWSFLSLLVVEWLLQPFLYSDQLMCSIGFVLAGALLAEFNPDSPGGWRSAMPSHPDTSPPVSGGCSSPAAAPPGGGRPR